MKLYFRLLLTLFRIYCRPGEVPLKGPFERTFRVHLTDLDFLRHMTNSRYVSLLDLMTYEFGKRTKVWDPLIKNGLKFVLAATYVRYRRELRLGDRFTIRLDGIYARGTWLYLDYRFIKEGMVHCHVLVKLGFYKKGEGMQTCSQMGAIRGRPMDLEEPPPHIGKWIEAEEAIGNVVNRGH